MIALRGLKTIPFRQHAVAFIITLPALLACLGMQARASFYAMIFTGGSRVLFTNLCEVVLFPYFGIFILAWGSAFLPTCPATASDTFSQLDCAMTRFFRGVGIVTILGFVLGLLNLLLPAVTIPIFVVTLYVYFLYSPDQLWKVFPWLLTCDSPTRQALQKFPILRVLLLCVRLGIPLVIIIVLLMKGIVPDIYSQDIMPYYAGYLAEVRLQHGIWMDPGHPVIVDFLTGRGNGVYLFLSSFTSPYITAIIGCVYWISIAVLGQRIAALITPKSSPIWHLVQWILPDLILLSFLVSPIVETDFAKYHLQTGAVFFYLTWITLLFLFFNPQQAKWVYKSLIPLCMAIPLMLPEYQALVVIVLVLSALALFIMRARSFIRYFVYLFVIGSVACLCVSAFNEAYVGLIDANPSTLFLKFSLPERLQLWTSPEQLAYVALSFPSEVKISGTGLSMDVLAAWIKALFPDPKLILLLSFSLIPGLLLIWINLQRKVRQPLFVKLALPFGLAAINLIAYITILFPKGQDNGFVERLSVLQFLFLADFIVLFLVACLFLPSGSLVRYVYKGWRALICVLQSRIFVMMCVLYSYYLGTALLIMVVDHSSLGGEFSYQAIYPIFTLFLLTLLGIELVRNLFASTEPRVLPIPWIQSVANLAVQDAAFRSFNSVLLVGTITFMLFLSSVVQIHNFARNSLIPLTTAAKYFVGQEHLEETAQKLEADWHWVNHRRCLQIAQVVPGDSPVLPLNGLSETIACWYSELIPRNKVIQNYQSILSPGYPVLLFGSVQDSDAVLKRLGVNYFYVLKQNAEFWGPAFGPSFTADRLAANFDIFWESDEAYILTWRGQGMRPVSSDEAAAIQALRARTATSKLNWERTGWLAYTRLKASLGKN